MKGGRDSTHVKYTEKRLGREGTYGDGQRNKEGVKGDTERGCK